MQHEPPPERSAHVLLSLVLAAPAFLVGAAFLLWETDPVLLGRILSPIDTLLARAWSIVAFIVVPVTVAVLVLYPPAWPALRLSLERLRRRMSFDRKAARDLLQRLQEFENPRDLQSLGELYLDAGQPEQAVGPLARAQELDPEVPRVAYLIGRCMMDLGNAPEALAAIESALSRDPEIAFGEGWLLAGELALEIGRDEDALARAAEHERRFGESIRGKAIAARATHRLGRSDESRAAIERLLELPPGIGKRYPAREAYLRARAKLARISGRQM